MGAPRRSSFSLLLAIGLIVLWAAIAFAAGAAPARAGSGNSVEVVDFAYAPAELTIEVGDTVTWTNRDAVAHTATDVGGAWDTGLLEEGESASITFTAAGTYDYLCTPHPSMTGRIVVVATAQPSPTPAPARSQAPASGGSLPDVAMNRSAIHPATVIGIGLLLFAGLVGIARVRRRGDEG